MNGTLFNNKAYELYITESSLFTKNILWFRIFFNWTFRMPNEVKEFYTKDETGAYVFEQNVTITLKDASGLVRANVYRPKTTEKVPVLVTYGPYGKDIPYKDFYPQSFSEVNPEQRSEHSAWETPDPGYWTSQGYAVVRADERGTGQSMGKLDTMSRGTSEAFFDVVEWAAEQEWSSGKVGLLQLLRWKSVACCGKTAEGSGVYDSVGGNV